MDAAFCIDAVVPLAPAAGEGGGGGVVVRTPRPGAQGRDLGLAIQAEVTLAPSVMTDGIAWRMVVRCGGRTLGGWPVPGRVAGTGPRRTLSAAVSLLDVPPTFALTVSLEGADGSPVLPVARLHGRRRACLSPRPARIRPLMLVSLGRSGSTLAMRLLSAHPEIVAWQQHPMETRVAQYVTHGARVRLRPATPAGDPVRDFGTSPVLAPNPYFGPDAPVFPFFAGPAARSALLDCVDQVEQFYDWAGRMQDKRPSWFIEKMVPASDRVQDLESVLGPVRTIVLVRDFRDFLCSVLAFNRKRGFAAFGQDAARNSAESVEIARQHAEQLVAFFNSTPDCGLMRYETLVTSPQTAVVPCLEALGLDAAPQTVAAMLSCAHAAGDEVPEHRTAPSPAASIGRWRTDLPEPVAHHANVALGPALRAFGYGE